MKKSPFAKRPFPISIVLCIIISLLFCGSSAYAKSILLVDFGADTTQNTFGLQGWQQAFTGPDAAYYDEGPGGVRVRLSNVGHSGHYAGIKGEKRQFQAGEGIMVTWYNNSDKEIIFSPRISVDDPDKPIGLPSPTELGKQRGEAGEWYFMSKTSIPPHQYGRSFYRFNEDTAGEYRLVNVNLGPSGINKDEVGFNYSNRVILDKIELSGSIERTVPSQPKHVNATVHSDRTIELTWDAAVDDIGVMGYRIYRDHLWIGSSIEPHYRDIGYDIRGEGKQGLFYSVKHIYTVKAVDINSNESPLSLPKTVTTPKAPERLLDKSNFEYKGAFKLPANGWKSSKGESLTHYSEGDGGSNGPDDGYPGSLYGGAGVLTHTLGEVTIPRPVISPDKDIDDLLGAEIIQPLTNLEAYELVGNIAYSGIEYLPKQGSQTSGKLYSAWRQTWADKVDGGGAWGELDLSDHNLQGRWYIGTEKKPWDSLVGQYLFALDSQWAAEHVSGRLLVTGGHSTTASQGPTLYAFAPWQEGNPPVKGAELPYTTLMKFGGTRIDQDPGYPMQESQHNDFWNGGGWLQAGEQSGVAIIGTKAIGEEWYGFEDGTLFRECINDPALNCGGRGHRGWFSEKTEARILLFDPQDFAIIAKGERKPYQIRPYTVIQIGEYLFDLNKSGKNELLGAAAFDSHRGYLYIVEVRVKANDGAPVIHVFKLQ